MRSEHTRQLWEEGERKPQGGTAWGFIEHLLNAERFCRHWGTLVDMPETASAPLGKPCPVSRHARGRPPLVPCSLGTRRSPSAWRSSLTVMPSEVAVIVSICTGRGWRPRVTAGAHCRGWGWNPSSRAPDSGVLALLTLGRREDRGPQEGGLPKSEHSPPTSTRVCACVRVYGVREAAGWPAPAFSDLCPRGGC